MERIISQEFNEIDEEETLRPDRLSDYIGQDDLKENLKVFIEAAKYRNETLDHTLLYGPPGLGKTTLAHIIAKEMNTNIRFCSGPAIERSGDLAAILSSLQEGEVLFIDEIHRLPKVVEEILYSAMEDFCLDIVVGKDASVRSIRIDLPPFTLVGATTRAGALSAPLRDRFGIVSKLEYYNESQLSAIVNRTSRVMDMAIDADACLEVARRSRGTPRIANRLFKRIRDFAQVLQYSTITQKICDDSLNRLKVDFKGLDDVDIRYLKGVIERFNGGPVGLESLASAISEESMTLEDVYEPYLIKIGFINRTMRGRVATKMAYDHLNLPFIEN